MRQAKPAQLLGLSAPAKAGSAARAPADSKHACRPDLPPVAVSDGAQQQRQLHTWAGKVAGAQARCDAQPNCDPFSRQGSAAQPGGNPSAVDPQSATAPCEQQQQQEQKSAACNAAELAAAKAAAEVDASRERKEMAAEVERLRSALTHSEAARQREVAQLLQTAAQHEAQVRDLCAICLAY